jgi:hypothetical protein
MTGFVRECDSSRPAPARAGAFGASTGTTGARGAATSRRGSRRACSITSSRNVRPAATSIRNPSWRWRGTGCAVLSAEAS